jgi:hypothetical protein
VILLVVMTCPRPTGAPDYLPATLEALDENGADLCDEKWISVDGAQAKHTVSFHGGDFVVSYHASKSPWPNFGVVVPCLVDHVGDYTAIPGNERVPVRGNNYAGVRDSVWHDLQRPFYETLREELKAKK